MPKDPLDEQRIVEQHAGLVRALVGRTLRLYSRLPGSFEREDLECYGRIGLLHAARTYDDTRGVAFSTYAYKCIQNQIVGALDRTRGVIEGPGGAAALLRVHPNTLRSRMDKLGIKRPGNEGR